MIILRSSGLLRVREGRDHLSLVNGAWEGNWVLSLYSGRFSINRG
jgi:hypothetical protein